MALLEYENVRKSFFGVEVLHGIGFTLEAGRVLGLVGENGSGKSTAMNILGGVHPMNSGAIRIDGRPYAPRRPRDAQDAGIAFIHQELNLFENLSIEENLFVGGFPRRGRLLPLIDRADIRTRTRAALEAVDLEHAPSTPVMRLSQGERQLVEIAKALNADAKIIIFDEPTTSLTRRETERLFEIIGRLRARGIAMIYISHILGDVLTLCDDVVVLRDGAVVGGGPAEEMTVERMISAMVGRKIDQLFPPRHTAPSADPVLEVEGLSEPGIVKDIGFTLHRGEVLGVSGLMGSGRSELARILFGLDPHATGRIRLDGAPLDRPTPAICMNRGMAFLTEDRRAEGLLMEASITDNVALPSLNDRAAGWLRLIQRTRLGDDVHRAADEVRINRTDYEGTLVRTLSGGNQQKVVLAKWLMRAPSVFILDEPTRGIDVGAKFEIYKLINDLVGAGAGVLFISSEMEELIGMCDRILVMAHGEIRGVHNHADFDGERLLESAMWHGRLEPAAVGGGR